ncbi:uncharacterized protein LOC142785252 isoform X2 [Rhipicephalus microplus]|uniref:uncharacterized protein LOC142785252 isoform X2 n=1 Tax=Rhipicephalus microplus TaxID=6941 RepID=UPI003F6B45EE
MTRNSWVPSSIFPGCSPTSTTICARPSWGSLPDSSKVLRALGSSDSSLDPEFGICREEKAVREFFTCGLLFNVIVSSDPPKEKLCTAYVNLDKCAKDLHCSNKSEFNTHSKHVLDVLLNPYSDYCSGFVDGKNNSTVAPPATPTAPTSPETSATTKAKCSESVQLEKYFHCGLVFIFNLRDAMFPNESAQNSLPCDLIRAHKLCVEAAMATPNCPDKIGISKILEYVDSELHAASGVKCPTVKRDRIARRQHRSSAHHCHVLQYASTYFTCGTMFLRGTYPDRPATGEACKLYYDFLKCVEELVVCRQQSDLLVSFNHFSEILTDGYKDACKGHNISDTCNKLTLLKNFFLCGLIYCHSYNAYLTYLHLSPTICKILDNFVGCVYDRVLINSCGYTKLFASIREVRDYILVTVINKHSLSCKIPTGISKKRTALAAHQSSCDEFSAVKRLLLCGVAFHGMLPSTNAAGNGSPFIEWTKLGNDTTAALCPLVKEMKYCMYSATHDSGCSEAMFLSAEISLIRKRLLEEFGGACDYEAQWTSKSTDHQPRPIGCELKEFTEDWEACDASVGREATDLFWKGSVLQGIGTVSKWQRRRLCSELYNHQRCMHESATRHYCPELATRLAGLGAEESLNKLGLFACLSSSSSSSDNQRTALLLLAAGGVHVLACRHAGAC